jgi:endonuclease I
MAKRIGLPVAWNLAGGYQKPLAKVLVIHRNTIMAAVMEYGEPAQPRNTSEGEQMRYTNVRRYLKPYNIVDSRKTTIVNALVSALAPHDDFDDQKVQDAIRTCLEQDLNDLVCVYCGAPAQTWDHVVALVHREQFSGYGHRLGNLLPCCKSCNSRKGNQDWQAFMANLEESPEHDLRRDKIARYLRRYQRKDEVPQSAQQELIKTRDQIIELMAKADEIADRVRADLRLSPRRPRGRKRKGATTPTTSEPNADTGQIQQRTTFD